MWNSCPKFVLDFQLRSVFKLHHGHLARLPLCDTSQPANEQDIKLWKLLETGCSEEVKGGVLRCRKMNSILVVLRFTETWAFDCKFAWVVHVCVHLTLKDET
jgi:hypothetical protein